MYGHCYYRISAIIVSFASLSHYCCSCCCYCFYCCCGCCGKVLVSFFVFWQGFGLLVWCDVCQILYVCSLLFVGCCLLVVAIWFHSALLCFHFVAHRSEKRSSRGAAIDLIWLELTWISRIGLHFHTNFVIQTLMIIMWCLVGPKIHQGSRQVWGESSRNHMWTQYNRERAKGSGPSTSSKLVLQTSTANLI